MSIEDRRARPSRVRRQATPISRAVIQYHVIECNMLYQIILYDMILYDIVITSSGAGAAERVRSLWVPGPDLLRGTRGRANRTSTRRRERENLLLPDT